MISQFFAVLFKEFLTFFRSFGLVAFILYAFTLDLYVISTGIEMKPRNITVGYVDFTQGINSNRILSHLNKPEFRKPIKYLNEKELKNEVLNKKIMIGIIFDSDFDKTKHINIIADAISASQTQLAITYIQNILINSMNISIPLNVKVHKLFNQNADTKLFMAVTEIINIVTMMVILLVAVTFVREKEKGTWDIMLLSPMNSLSIILAKALSQILIVMGALFISLGIVLFGLIGVPLNGSLPLFFFSTFVFAFALSGIGFFIASVSSSIIQVSQLSFLILMPLIFLSGAWTPIHDMSFFNQLLSLFSPFRYYIEITQDIFFRGSDISMIMPNILYMGLIGIVLFLYGYKKIGKLF